MTEPDSPPPASAGPRLLGPADVRRLAATVGIRPTKQRGQNFVIDPNTVRRIVRSAGLARDDVVLEIGPGLGSLTLALLERVEAVVAVEVDDTLAALLPRTLAERAPAGDVRVLHADALRLTQVPGPPPTALVANLPYNVSVPVLLHLLDLLPSLRCGLVLVQAEVAARLTAAPGSRTYGVPSVKTAWYADLRPAGKVPRTVFWPAPHVDSALVAWTRREPPASRVGRAAVFAAIDAAFAQRRKTLRGALAGRAGSPAGAERALLAAGLSPRVRGEQLSLAQFVTLADALGDAGAGAV